MHYIKAKDINHFDEFDVGTDGKLRLPLMPSLLFENTFKK